MSDLQQGPGWWQASDGKWYPPTSAPYPPPTSTPSRQDHKSAKAEAKAAKARAKALRPWYKKKRYIFLAVIVLGIVIGVVSSQNNKKLTSVTFPPTCAKTHPSYPDQQLTHDCVALPNHTMSMSGSGALITAVWSQQVASGDNDICGNITYKNLNSSTLDYDPLDWKLQSPAGSVVDTNFDGSLNSGTLIKDGSVTGTVCFDNPGQSGTYVGIYKPDPFSADRGIWLFTL